MRGVLILLRATRYVFGKTISWNSLFNCTKQIGMGDRAVAELSLLVKYNAKGRGESIIRFEFQIAQMQPETRNKKPETLRSVAPFKSFAIAVIGAEAGEDFAGNQFDGIF